MFPLFLTTDGLVPLRAPLYLLKPPQLCTPASTTPAAPRSSQTPCPPPSPGHLCLPRLLLLAPGSISRLPPSQPLSILQPNWPGFHPQQRAVHKPPSLGLCRGECALGPRPCSPAPGPPPVAAFPEISTRAPTPGSRLASSASFPESRPHPLPPCPAGAVCPARPARPQPAVHTTQASPSQAQQ